MELKEENKKNNTRKTTEKKEVKKTTTKKGSTAPKKEEIKKVANKTNNKKEVKKEKQDEIKIVEKEPEIEFEEEVIKKDKIEKYGNTVIVSLLLVLSIIFLMFLVNKTFFRNKYKNGDFEMNLPLFVYFVSDDGNTIKFKTLRKSKYVKQYFEEYLSNLDNFDYYVCKNGKHIYYNSDNKNAIYSINVDKNFALKTITVKYDIVEENTLCQ